MAKRSPPRGTRSPRRSAAAPRARDPRPPRASELDVALDLVRGGLLVLDGELRVERASASWADAFAIAPADVVGRPLSGIGRGEWNDATILERLSSLLRGGAPFRDHEVVRELPHGGRRVLRVAAALLTPPGSAQPRLLLAVADETDAREAAELRKALAAAEKARDAEAQAGRLRDEFVATVSHELRGPLGSIANCVHLHSPGQCHEPEQR